MEVLLGFVVAVVIALTGVGAGVMISPMLILFLGVPVETAVSTALAYSAIVKLIVVPVQVIRGQVNYRILACMLAGGLPGVILGSVLFKHAALHGQRPALYAFLGFAIIFTSGWNLWRHFRPAKMGRPQKERAGWLAAVMLPIGAEVGFSSSGAGALGTLALLGLTSLPAAQVVGTDLAFGLGIALTGSAVHLTGSTCDVALLTRLALGGVLGAVLGSVAAPKIPNRQLRFALCLWLIFIGMRFCLQATGR